MRDDSIITQQHSLSNFAACGCWGLTKSLQLNVVLLLLFIFQHIVVARAATNHFFSKVPHRHLMTFKAHLTIVAVPLGAS